MLFKTFDIYHSMVDILLNSLQRSNCDAHIYLFMPDHVHLLIEGKSENSDLWQFMVDFKQKSGYWLSRNCGYKWQKDFYDHILRKEEDLLKQVRYILGNPVRKGFVKNWKEYSFKGPTIYDFNQWEIR